MENLIDKASRVCGSDAKLARRLGVSHALLTLVRKGERAMTPTLAAELADIAGDDAREAVIAAVIESAKGTKKEGAMREILGKALAAGVAGMLAISYSGDSNSSTVRQTTTRPAVVDNVGKEFTKSNTLYIVSLAFRWIRKVVAGLGSAFADPREPSALPARQ